MPSGQGGTGGSFRVEYVGIYEALATLKHLPDTLRRLANGDLRAESRQIAIGLTPYIASLVRTSPAPQADKLAETIRPKSDRMVIIRVGAVNPRLSGFKAGQAGNRKWKGSLAWGVEKGPYPGTPNRYRVGRSDGYAIAPHLDDIRQKAVPAYEKVLTNVLRRYGVI